MNLRNIKFKIDGNSITIYGEHPWTMLGLDGYERKEFCSDFIHYLYNEGFFTMPGKVKVKIVPE